jgi:hypothetical protein
MEELPDEVTARAIKAALPAQPNQPANTRLMARITFVAGVSGLTLCLAGVARAITETNSDCTTPVISLPFAARQRPTRSTRQRSISAVASAPGLMACWPRRSRPMPSSGSFARRRALPATKR